ncbi:ornithine cyclodeaminase family protein [Zavarzinella formosa]|uniref:ornithine cyclodeaminase family protein n=1 Tax=Zavarzinella formosa TaxID=360055 RepID=UPI0003634A2D|nr:ornithine cyclodeaminase family protein [Zavarzinella formosa]
MAVLHLNEDEVRELLSMEMAIEAVETGLRKMALEEAFSNPRSRCQTDHAMLHVLPAACKTMGVIGFKSYVTTKSRQTFHVTIYNGKTGEMLAIIQGDMLGQLRTGAASAVATKHLSRPDSKTAAILGSGKQARTQLLGVSKVRKLEQARVYSSNEANRKKFAEEMSVECQIPVTACATVEETVREADIICTATTAREPILKGEWLIPGQHLNIAGSNFISKAEIDAEVINRASLVTIDSKDQGKLEAGDLVPALDAGILEWYDVVEIGRVVAMRNPGRQSPNDITLFKSLGIGLEDIAVGIRLYEKAKAEGRGRWLDI